MQPAEHIGRYTQSAGFPIRRATGQRVPGTTDAGSLSIP